MIITSKLIPHNLCSFNEIALGSLHLSFFTNVTKKVPFDQSIIIKVNKLYNLFLVNNPSKMSFIIINL